MSRERILRRKTLDSISVVIPVHDPFGFQKKRIMRMAHSLAIQDYPITQVVITANHQITYQAELARVLSFAQFLEVRNIPSVNAPENLNVGISLATEPLIKILFQDDFLMGINHVSKVVQGMSNSASTWLTTRSLNFDEETASVVSDILPRFTESIRNGVNTIGAPSTITFLKSAIRKFSEDMIYMFDCEWYLTMAHNFGPPIVARDVAVAIGMHRDQLTHTAANKLKEERELTRDKHKRATIFSRDCACRTHFGAE